MRPHSCSPFESTKWATWRSARLGATARKEGSIPISQDTRSSLEAKWGGFDRNGAGVGSEATEANWPWGLCQLASHAPSPACRGAAQRVLTDLRPDGPGDLGGHHGRAGQRHGAIDHAAWLHNGALHLGSNVTTLGRCRAQRGSNEAVKVHG